MITSIPIAVYKVNPLVGFIDGLIVGYLLGIVDTDGSLETVGTVDRDGRRLGRSDGCQLGRIDTVGALLGWFEGVCDGL